METKDYFKELSLSSIETIRSLSVLDMMEIKTCSGDTYHAILVKFDIPNGTIKFIPH